MNIEQLKELRNMFEDDAMIIINDTGRVDGLRKLTIEAITELIAIKEQSCTTCSHYDLIDNKAGCSYISLCEANKFNCPEWRESPCTSE